MTQLDRDIVRETTLLVDGREIIIRIAADQRIYFRLKGDKSDSVEIGIDTLFNQLTDGQPKVAEPVKKGSISVKNVQGSTKNDVTISLNDLRSNNLVTKIDLPLKIKLEELICDLIKEKRNILF
jgi:hypothetical protein